MKTTHELANVWSSNLQFSTSNDMDCTSCGLTMTISADKNKSITCMYPKAQKYVHTEAFHPCIASYSNLHWEATILRDHHSGVSCRAVPDQGIGSPLSVFVAMHRQKHRLRFPNHSKTDMNNWRHEVVRYIYVKEPSNSKLMQKVTDLFSPTSIWKLC